VLTVCSGIVIGAGDDGVNRRTAGEASLLANELFAFVAPLLASDCVVAGLGSTDVISSGVACTATLGGEGGGAKGDASATGTGAGSAAFDGARAPDLVAAAGFDAAGAPDLVAAAGFDAAGAPDLVAAVGFDAAGAPDLVAAVGFDAAGAPDFGVAGAPCFATETVGFVVAGAAGLDTAGAARFGVDGPFGLPNIPNPKSPLLLLAVPGWEALFASPFLVFSSLAKWLLLAFSLADCSFASLSFNALSLASCSLASLFLVACSFDCLSFSNFSLAACSFCALSCFFLLSFSLSLRQKSTEKLRFRLLSAALSAGGCWELLERPALLDDIGIADGCVDETFLGCVAGILGDVGAGTGLFGVEGAPEDDGCAGVFRLAGAEDTAVGVASGLVSCVSALDGTGG